MKMGLFTGLTGLDIVYYKDYFPVENKKSKTEKFKIFVGGPAANAAITYSILGGKAHLITCIGDSEIGRIIKRELEDDYKIEVLDLSDDEEVLPCISSIAVNTLNANRTVWSGQQKYNPDIERIKIDKDISLMDFCFSDCNLQEISMEVVRLASEMNKPIILDIGSWKENIDFYICFATDVIASNDFITPNGINFLEYVKRFPVKNLAVTNGEKEIKWQTCGLTGYIKPPYIIAKDTLGAGDVFHGAYCFFKYDKELSFVNALIKSSDVAALSVQYYGTREGVMKYVKDQI